MYTKLLELVHRQESSYVGVNDFAGSVAPVPAMFNYANYLRRYKKDLVMSEQLLARVYAFMPKSDIVMMTFALLYFQRGDYVACKKKLDDLIEVFPDYASAHFLRYIMDYFIENNGRKGVFEQMKKYPDVLIWRKCSNTSKVHI